MTIANTYIGKEMKRKTSTSSNKVVFTLSRKSRCVNELRNQKVTWNWISFWLIGNYLPESKI